MGTIMALSSILVTTLLALVMKNRGKLQQEWLESLQNMCGYDKDKTLADFSKSLYTISISLYTKCMLPLGLYIGQIAFRYFGGGRLDFNAYTSKQGLWH